LNLIRLTARDTTKIEFNINNFDFLEYESSLFLMPYDDWHISGTWSYFGLPDFTGQYYYNGLPVRDPLFGSYPISWFNARNTGFKYERNKFYIKPRHIKKEKLYSKFDYYQGDYSFKSFSLVAGQQVTEDFSWILYGNNLGYDGGYGLYGPVYNQTGESVSQSYHIDCFIDIDNWKAKTGISYEKFMPGLLSYNQSYYSPEQQFLQWQQQGNLRQWKFNHYLLFQHQGRDSTALGINLANYNYRFNFPNFPLKAEGRFISGKLARNLVLNGNTFKIKLEPVLEKVYYRYYNSINQNRLTTQIQYADSIWTGKLFLSLGTTNLTPIYRINYQKRIFSPISLELASQQKHISYPLIYHSPEELNVEEIYDDNSSYLLNSITFNLETDFLTNNLSFCHLSSDLKYPFKNSLEDSVVTFKTLNIPRLYLSDKFNLNLPWQGKLSGRILFTPEAKRDFLQLQGFGRYQQFLSPVLKKTAELIPDWLGFFQYYFKQLAENMTPYLAFDFSYMHGGENLFWFQEFRNLGKIPVNYFTNKRMNINFKAGFKVETFHFFFAMYNMEGRQFSSISGMPFRNRLQIMGVEWSFLK